jgi:hypothetical protein
VLNEIKGFLKLLKATSQNEVNAILYDSTVYYEFTKYNESIKGMLLTTGFHNYLILMTQLVSCDYLLPLFLNTATFRDNSEKLI